MNINASGAVLITGQKDGFSSRIGILITATLGQGNSGNISLQASNGVELERGFMNHYPAPPTPPS